MATRVSDIKIYRSGRWHSMTNTRYYVNGAWHSFKSGDKIYHNGEWYEVAPVVAVYITPMVAENKDGEPYWFFTISTDPDILMDSDVTIQGSVTMSDTGAYNVDITATADQWSVNTGIPYVEGVTITRTDLTATFSNTSYIVGKVTFTGVYNLMNIDEEEEE